MDVAVNNITTTIASQTKASMSSLRCRRKSRNTLPTGHCITRHVPLCSKASVESGTTTWLQSIRYVSWILYRKVRYLRSFAPIWCSPTCGHASECPTGCVLCTSCCHCSTSARRQNVWIYLIVGFI